MNSERDDLGHLITVKGQDALLQFRKNLRSTLDQKQPLRPAMNSTLPSKDRGDWKEVDASRVLPLNEFLRDFLCLLLVFAS